MHRVVALLRDVRQGDDWSIALQYVEARLHAKKDVVRISSPYHGQSAEQHLADDYCFVGSLLECALNGGVSVTVLVDHVVPERLNPLSPPAWETLLARLILAYPEVRWLFSRIVGEDVTQFRRLHGLHNLFYAASSPLFDPTALRNCIRERAASGQDTSIDARYLPLRMDRAIALDEERSYATLHAYAAYRFGYCAETLTTFEVAQRTLSGSCDGLSPPALVFEDICVNFPDTYRYGFSKLYADPAGVRGQPNRADEGALHRVESNLVSDENPEFQGRAHEWPVLEQAERRIFVTSGQRRLQDARRWLRNSAHIAGLKARGVYTRTLHKPYAGIYRLWGAAGLNRQLRWADDASGCRFRGVAKGFIWPPGRQARDTSNSGHSSPGALLSIADNLTARAASLWDELNCSGSVEQAVRGAVLATDALELLGCRTPTQSIEALRLKHKFELLAECQFSGVEHHVCIKERIVEVRRDIKAISYWFGPRRRKLAAWNAESQILTDLVRILREHGHFDEEQYCMSNIRRATRKVWLQEKRPLSFLGYPFRWYVEILLDRPIHFIGALSFWTAGLMWFFRYHGEQVVDVAETASPQAAPVHNLAASLAETMTTFFQTQPPSNLAWPALIVSSAAILFGFVHLGIFISHLYTQVSRR